MKSKRPARRKGTKDFNDLTPKQQVINRKEELRRLDMKIENK